MPDIESSNSTNNNERARNGSVDVNSWLPITASRKAKWYYAAFHNVTAMVGAGVLGLPFAVSQLTWFPGISVIALSWLVTFYTLWQLVELHEDVPGKRFDRYPDLGMHAFGPRKGYWFVMPQQMLVQVASDIVYVVTGGKSLKKFVDLLFPKEFTTIRETYFLAAFSVMQLALSQIPNFNDLKVISFLAALMSCMYSMIAFVASTIHAVHGHKMHHEVDYGVRSKTVAGKTFDAFNALGTIAFAFAAHSVVLEIQATIPSTPEKPSKKPMWKGAVWAYVIVGLCYFSVAIAGFVAFGNKVEDDILISLERPAGLIAAANLMVFIHVLGSYQVFAMPVFDSIESCLVNKLKFKPCIALRLWARSAYVLLTSITGIMFPFFGGLLGFCGGLAYTSTSYLLPCMMWLALKKPKMWSFHWVACSVCILVGGVITLVAPIGGMRQIIISSKKYEFFS